MYLRIFFIKLIIIVIFIIIYITICNNKIRYILLFSLKKSYFVILEIECKMIVANLFPKKKFYFLNGCIIIKNNYNKEVDKISF